MATKASVELQVGDDAPDFTAPSSEGTDITLSELQGKNVVLYFYPKDDTPGCTKEACSFRDNLARLQKADTVVLGVSKDKAASHEKFRDKYDLNFPLVSDADGKICDAYGVWREKMRFGKTSLGIVRSTFLIDKEGVIRKIWRNVKVDGHTDAVLKAIDELD